MPIAIGNLIKDKAGLNGFSIEEITTAIEKTVEADYKARGEDGKNRITNGEGMIGKCHTD